MPFYWPPAAETGVGVGRFAAMLCTAVVVAAATTAFQELVMRPRLQGTSRQKSEKVFFSSSLALVAVFVTALLYMHYGPNPLVPGGTPGDENLVLFLFALWFGHEMNELAQMRLRRSDFSPSFLGLMEPHHVISMGWFGAWILLAAPAGPSGVPLWNTGIVYLCGCAPNEIYKLISLYYNPPWLGWLVAPATYMHWMVLLVSQAYWFTQCPCMASGCWTPGSLIPFVGGWAMAFFDMPFFFNAFISKNSRMLGVPMDWQTVVALVLGREQPSSKTQLATTVPTASDSDEDSEGPCSSGDEADGQAGVSPARARPMVSVELVFRGHATGKAAAGGGAKGAEGSNASAAAGVGLLAASMPAVVRQASSDGSADGFPFQ